MNDVDMCHYMIDLETLGTRSDSVILSIGVVQFDLKDKLNVLFHRGISIDSCLKVGLSVSGGTIEFWLKQPKENIDRLVNLQHDSLEDVLNKLSLLFNAIHEDRIYVWSYGSSFDIVLLENAYKAIEKKPWWKYSHVRDTRTLFDLVDYTYTAKGGHDALEDAVNQVVAVQECYKKLFNVGGRKNGSN